MCIKAKAPVLATVLFALATTVIAVPASTPSESVPEVIPGPGLPSLESLGLTSAELYARNPFAELAAREEGYDPQCQTWSTGAVGDVIACFNYLQSIGDHDCTVNGYNQLMCRVGTADVGGGNLLASQGQSVTSSCHDVAYAVQWVFTYCNNDGQVGGSQAAYGNGNLIVSVDHEGWFN